MSKQVAVCRAFGVTGFTGHISGDRARISGRISLQRWLPGNIIVTRPSPPGPPIAPPLTARRPQGKLRHRRYHHPLLVLIRESGTVSNQSRELPIHGNYGTFRFLFTLKSRCLRPTHWCYPGGLPQPFSAPSCGRSSSGGGNTKKGNCSTRPTAPTPAATARLPSVFRSSMCTRSRWTPSWQPATSRGGNCGGGGDGGGGAPTVLDGEGPAGAGERAGISPSDLTVIGVVGP